MNASPNPTLVTSVQAIQKAGLIHRVLRPETNGPLPTVVMLHGRSGNEDVGIQPGPATAYATAMQHPGLVRGIAGLVGFIPGAWGDVGGTGIGFTRLDSRREPP
jgi:hypothetical protein